MTTTTLGMARTTRTVAVSKLNSTVTFRQWHSWEYWHHTKQLLGVATPRRLELGETGDQWTSSHFYSLFGPMNFRPTFYLSKADGLSMTSQCVFSLLPCPRMKAKERRISGLESILVTIIRNLVRRPSYEIVCPKVSIKQCSTIPQYGSSPT